MSRYEVSEYRVYPTGYDEATFSDKHTWSITVVERGDDSWAVKGNSGVLNRDGEWEYEMSPSSRTDEFLRRCRFTREHALERALEVVDSIEVNGHTIAQADAWVAARVAEAEATSE